MPKLSRNSFLALIKSKILKIVRICDGIITVLQNNEPAGDQHAFHYHMYVIPRFEGDNFHKELWKTQKSEPEEIVHYAEDSEQILT